MSKAKTKSVVEQDGVNLTESDVRRIVREELEYRFRGVESAMRSFLDKLFNTTN